MSNFLKSFSLTLGVFLLLMVFAGSLQPRNADGPGDGGVGICFNDPVCVARSNPVTKVPAACSTLPDPCEDPGCACRAVVFVWNCECKLL